MATAKEVIDRASMEVGTKEIPANSNNVVYNTLYYGRPVSGSKYPWCCAFIWWLLSTSGISVPKTALCMTLAQWFKSQGQWFTDPQIGDIVFFKYGKDPKKWTDHVGIVVSVRGREIETIEGNTSVNSNNNGGEVMVRRRSSHIVGYGRPKYTGVHETPETSTNTPTLRRGSKGEYVKAWQLYLISCGISCGDKGADSDFGPATENAVRTYQQRMGLPVTGVIDADDWASVGSYGSVARR